MLYAYFEDSFIWTLLKETPKANFNNDFKIVPINQLQFLLEFRVLPKIDYGTHENITLKA